MPLAFVDEVVKSLNREILEKLSRTRIIKHPGENGKAREQIISDYLSNILPKCVRIGTGFIIDSAGEISRQIDVLIYRDDYHPVITVGTINYYMAESVVAVIEIKASIKNTKTLADAIENIKSAKKLDRTNKGNNYIISEGKTRKGFVDNSKFEHQIFGAILTEESLSADTLSETFQKFHQENPNRNVWPNMYVDVRGSSFRYIEEDFKVTAVPQKAFGFIISDTDADNYTPPLLEITFELLNFIRVTPLIDYNPCDYFYGTVGSSKIAKKFPPLYFCSALNPTEFNDSN